MATKLTIQQKKDYAFALYVHQRLTQKEAAEKAGVSTKTMCQWVAKEKWDTRRVSIIVTKEEQLRRLYAQIEELNSAIEQKPEGKRYANSKEADTLSKLTKSAKDLETETGISEIIEVGKLFTNHLKTFDLPSAQKFVKLLDDFIVTRL